jgi:myosin heavy subunit
MNSMTKKLPIIISSSAVAALTLIAVILHQGGYISKLEQTISNKDAELVLVNQQLEEQTKLTDEAVAALQVYKDSVSFLQLENQQLHTKIAELKGTIAKLNRIIQKHDDKVASLTEHINRLKECGKKYEARIKELEQEREAQLIKMEQMDKERISLLESKRLQEASKHRNEEQINSLDNKIAKQEMDLPDPMPQDVPVPIINQSPSEPSANPESSVSTELQTAIATRQQERLNNIVQNTAVKFSAISLRNREGGNDLKRVKKEDDWRYTFVDFNLSNADQEAIMDEPFVIQLFDLDNKVVVPFNEKNLALPKQRNGCSWVQVQI